MFDLLFVCARGLRGGGLLASVVVVGDGVVRAKGLKGANKVEEQSD